MRDNEGRLHALARRGGQMCECVRTNRCMTIACPTVGYAVVVASPTATGAKPLALNSVRGMPLHVRGMLTHAQVISDLRPFSVRRSINERTDSGGSHASVFLSGCWL